MAYDVHLSVVFPCNTNEPVAELAKRHLAKLPKDPVEARWFLEDLSKRSGSNPGPKGGLSLWGVVGNYARADEFVEVLRPFWEELLRSPFGPLAHEHIIVFYEPEQSERAQAYEIGLGQSDEEDGSETFGALFMKHHDLPFAWMQY